MIIGISGRIGSGKDTVGKIIQVLCFLQKMDIPFTIEAFNYNFQKNFDGDNYYGDWHIKKFAGKLKQICTLLTGIPTTDFEKQEVKDSLLGKNWNKLKFTPDKGDLLQEVEEMTVRTLLQKVGTEAMRNVIHPNVWVNALFADYKCLNELHVISSEGMVPPAFPDWIITDVRFPNEADAIKKRGGILIRLERHSAELSASYHPSETSLDTYEHFDDTIFNNRTIDNLVEEVHNLLIAKNILKGPY